MTGHKTGDGGASVDAPKNKRNARCLMKLLDRELISRIAGHVDNAASKNDASTGGGANHGTSGSTNRSSGIANVGTQTAVAHLPPLAKAAFTNAAPRNAEAPVPTWQQQLKARLSSCHTADDFVDVLKQLKDPDCQRFVVDNALNCLVSLDEINSLAKAVRDDSGLRKLVADRLWQNANSQRHGTKCICEGIAAQP